MSETNFNFQMTSKNIVPLRGTFETCNYKIQIGHHSLNIIGDLSIFLSLDLYKNYISGQSTFSSINTGFSEDEEIHVYEKLISLIGETQSVEMNASELKCAIAISRNMKNHNLRISLSTLLPKGGAFTLHSTDLSDFNGIFTERQACFSVCGENFECPKVLACYLSHRFFKEVISDSSFHQICLHPPEMCDEVDFITQFEAVFSILKGRPLIIAQSKAPIILSIAQQIENDELAAAVVTRFFHFSPNDHTGALNFLKEFDFFGDFLNDAISMVASNFYKSDLNALQTITIPIVKKVLCSPDLVAEDEDQILEFVTRVIRLRGEKALSLLALIRFEFLSPTSAKSFTDSFPIESISSDCWLSLCQRIKCGADFEYSATEGKRWKSPIKSLLYGSAEIFSRLGAEKEKRAKIEKELIGVKVELDNQIESNSQKAAEIIRINEKLAEIEGQSIQPNYIIFKGNIDRTTVIGVQIGFNGQADVPEGVVALSDGAFKNSSVSSVKLPNSLRWISDSAFCNCRNLMSINIPERVEVIGQKAFSNCESLKEIVIPPKVQVIEEQTFQNCKKLESIRIGDAVNSIGIRSFKGCESLKEFKVPPKVFKIEALTFIGCKSLISIELNEEIQSIGESAFMACESLGGNFIVPRKVTQIGDFAFCGCNSLRSIKIQSEITIGKSAFSRLARYDGNQFLATNEKIPAIIEFSGQINQGAGLLRTDNIALRHGGLNESFDTMPLSLEIPEGTTEISEGLFKNSNIISVRLPSSLITISDSAFIFCRNLREINIPSNVSYIGACAFCGCESLTKIEMPLKAQEIYGNTFKNCKSLVSVTLYKYIVRIGEYAFKCCESLKEILIPPMVTAIEGFAFAGCKSLRSIQISDAIEAIGEGAFMGCSSLSGDFNVPCKVKEIRKYTFYGCNSLNSIRFKSKIPIGESAFAKLDGFNGQNWSASGNENISAKILTDDSSTQSNNLIIKEISDCVTVIGINDECRGYIEIPEGVKVIGDGAFRDASVETLRLPNSITFICDAAFRNCKHLKNINIPVGVCGFGYEAFFGCESLKEISIPQKVTIIHSETFAGCSSLESINLSNGILQIDDEAFLNCSSLKTVTIPPNIRTIPNSVFSGCRSLTSISIGQFVEFIGEGAFMGCQSLIDFSLPPKVLQIMASTFKDCKSLTTIHMGDDIRYIKDSAFFGCQSLEKIDLPQQVIDIGRLAFANCKSLKSILLNNSIKEIGEGAFMGCSSLSGSIDIPPKLSILRNLTFCGCDSIRAIYIRAKTAIGTDAFRKLMNFDGINFYPSRNEDIKAERKILKK